MEPLNDSALRDYTTQRMTALREAAGVHTYRPTGAEDLPDSLLWDAIQLYAGALYNKAKLARDKYGFHPLGWAYPDWKGELQQGLAEHLIKGDSRDIGVYAVFAYFHGWPTATPAAAGATQEAQEALLEQVKEAARLARAAQWAPWYRNTGLSAVDIEDQDGKLIASFALGEKYGYQNACFVEAARNLDWSALEAALAPPAPAAAPVAGDALLRKLQAEAAQLVSEEDWQQLRYEGDMDAAAMQGRAMLATELLAALPPAPATGAAEAAGEATWVPVGEQLPKNGTTVWVAMLLPNKQYKVVRAFFRLDGIWDEFCPEWITHWQPYYVAEPAAPGAALPAPPATPAAEEAR